MSVSVSISGTNPNNMVAKAFLGQYGIDVSGTYASYTKRLLLQVMGVSNNNDNRGFMLYTLLSYSIAFLYNFMYIRFVEKIMTNNVLCDWKCGD